MKERDVQSIQSGALLRECLYRAAQAVHYSDLQYTRSAHSALHTEQSEEQEDNTAALAALGYDLPLSLPKLDCGQYEQSLSILFSSV